VAALWTVAAPACDVPVFRYALERWEADPYEVIVFHRGPLTGEQEAVLDSLEKGGTDGRANLEVTKVNLSGAVSATAQKLWNAQANPSPPWMVVKYPRKAGIERPVWAGPLNAETIGDLLASPVRRDIAQKLLNGEVVWLLLESGDQHRDERTGQLVEAELRKLEQTLVLPERSPQDPPVNPDLPLKIAFSTVRVSRSDPAERLLVNLLLNWNTNLTVATETMLFPIFGRGRVVPPAVGREIRAEAMRDMGEFLTGPCSCEIKELNPGYDLLLTANWGSLSGYQEVMVPESPPLVGMSQFVSTATNRPAASPAQSPVALASANPTPAAVRSSHLVRNLAIVFGIGFVFVAVTTWVLRVRANRGLR